ncbi:MAG: hypothetical protein V9E83_01830 [Baekduia sp.]
MDRALARNVLILLVAAALVAFAPGAGVTAEVAGTLVNGAILTVLVFAVAIFYRRHQSDLWGLGDEHRALLYAALGGFVVLMAGRETLTGSGAGTAVLVAGLAGVAVAAYLVVRRFRAYS